jgi:integrase/recombinase XerD
VTGDLPSAKQFREQITSLRGKSAAVVYGLTAPAFRKRLRTVSKELVVEPHLTPHRFRHSAATLLIEEGVDIRLVQRLLGHASIATTELYTKVSDNSLIAAIERADTLSQVDR